MDISKKCYQRMTPKQRAVATCNAFNRKDFTETDRLIKNAPKGGNHGQALRGLDQVQNVYSLSLARGTKDLLLAYGKLKAALSFCDGWTSAGGALDNKEYQENCAISESLFPVVERLVSEIAAVHQATREWCQKNKIPVETFSGSVCFLPLDPVATDSAVDGEMLNTMRKLFDEITLPW